MRISFMALVLVGIAVCMAWAHADVVAMLTLDAGEVERVQAPVGARLSGGKFDSGDVISLRAQGLPPVEAQIVLAGDGSYQAMWVEPHLASGQSRTYQLHAEKGESRPGFEFVQGEGYRDLTYAGKGVLRYMNRFDPNDFDNTFKPYHHVFDVDRDEFITKGAGGSFTHHRGLFFGFNKTQYGDFWHCREGVSQRFDHFVKDKEFTGPVAAREVSIVNWADKDGQPVARDAREVTAWQVSPSQRVFDWTITLEALRDDGLKLDGDPQHAGFHFRAAQEVAVGASGTRGGSATYVRPSGAKFTRNDEWLETPWVACSFTIKGNPYTVVHLDHPDNPGPTTYSTRGYGRFGAFFKGAIEKGKPLALKYRIIVIGGQILDEPALSRMHADYASPAKVRKD
jgi:hypothetical protein